MPCSDGGEHQYTAQREEIKQEQHRKEVDRLRAKLNKLEAALCAVFSDLVLRGMLDKVIETASLAGGIDLRKIYAYHKKYDKKRLAEKLDAFSTHEQAVLLSLLLERTGDTKNE